MKVISFLLLLSIGITGMGQKMASQSGTVYSQMPPISAAISQKVTSPELAREIIKEHFDFEANDDVKLLSDITSPYGRHFTFIQTYYGYEVFQAHIKLNTDKKGQVITNYSSKATVFSPQAPTLSSAYLQNAASTITNAEIQEAQLLWFPVERDYQLLASFKCTDSHNNYYQVLLNEDLSIFQKIDLLQYHTEIDTTAKALVHAPNPLNSVETEYGGNYVDNNDANSTFLDAERDTVDIKISYINSMFVLENDYVKIVESSIPTIPAVESTTPFFYYNRSESGFEDVNVMYHITKQQEYLQELGFTNLVDYQIAIDCHALDNADNSLFNSGTNPPSILFGEGGVDDAEDSDVIIHEYTHAIMESASPNTNFGSERGSMDEAYGDYLAVSYARTYNYYHDNWVFRWDGHNEYWDGREVVSNKLYPDDVQNSKYIDAPMWSAALMQIERNLGRDATTILTLEAAYSFSSNMSMSQAAELIMQTDVLINNGVNQNVLCWIFKDRGMITSCPSSRPSNLVGIENTSKNTSITLINSLNFSLGKENLIIKSESNFTVEVFDISGRLIYTSKNEQNSMELKPESIPSNCILIKVTNLEEVKTFKLIFAN